MEANARTGVTSQALEKDRNYKMSWPQYAREMAQRQELKGQAVFWLGQSRDSRAAKFLEDLITKP